VTVSNRLLRVRDVAETLGFSTTWVYELIKSGKLVGTRVGEKSMRIKESDFNNYLLSLNKEKRDDRTI
jgi:excisionase family DNA binding protein